MPRGPPSGRRKSGRQLLCAGHAQQQEHQEQNPKDQGKHLRDREGGAGHARESKQSSDQTDQQKSDGEFSMGSSPPLARKLSKTGARPLALRLRALLRACAWASLRRAGRGGRRSRRLRRAGCVRRLPRGRRLGGGGRLLLLATRGQGGSQDQDSGRVRILFMMPPQKDGPSGRTSPSCNKRAPARRLLEKNPRRVRGDAAGDGEESGT